MQKPGQFAAQINILWAHVIEGVTFNDGVAALDTEIRTA